MFPSHVYDKDTEQGGERNFGEPSLPSQGCCNYLNPDLLQLLAIKTFNIGGSLPQEPCNSRNGASPSQEPRNRNDSSQKEISSHSASDVCAAGTEKKVELNVPRYENTSSSECPITSESANTSTDRSRSSSSEADKYIELRRAQRASKRDDALNRPHSTEINKCYNNNHSRSLFSHSSLKLHSYTRRDIVDRRPFTNSRYYILPPDRFLFRAEREQVRRAPRELAVESEWTQLSKSIWEKFILNQQTSDTYRKKLYLWRSLFVFIRTNFPRYGLFLVGSTMSGFSSENSDVDLCLLVRPSETNKKHESLCHLEEVQKYLALCDFVNNIELIAANVPLLKFQGFGFKIDLNCNNAVGIRNTHLLHCYSCLDWRVRPLVIVIKLWAANHNINDAKSRTISSYALTLMVIHFLQCGVKPAVLPNLHAMYPEKFDSHSDIVRINMHEQLAPYESSNYETLGQLLLQFLRYYVHFDYSKYVISIRLAAKVKMDEYRGTRSYKNDPNQWKHLCIEEPFDLSNTSKSVYDYATFMRIKGVFKESYILLKATRDLSSIFQQ